MQALYRGFKDRKVRPPRAGSSAERLVRCPLEGWRKFSCVPLIRLIGSPHPPPLPTTPGLSERPWLTPLLCARSAGRAAAARGSGRGRARQDEPCDPGDAEGDAGRARAAVALFRCAAARSLSLSLSCSVSQPLLSVSLSLSLPPPLQLCTHTLSQPLYSLSLSLSPSSLTLRPTRPHDNGDQLPRGVGRAAPRRARARRARGARRGARRRARRRKAHHAGARGQKGVHERGAAARVRYAAGAAPCRSRH